MTRIKICGLRRADDARLAMQLGVDLVGCVIATDSPRCATDDEVSTIVAVAGAERVVLVTRRDGVEATLAVALRHGVRRLQIHGGIREDRTAVAEAGLLCHPVYAVAPGATDLPDFDVEPSEDRPAVLDVGQGGSGRTFDWSALPDPSPRHVFVAGGVTPDNVADLLRHRPWGIDLSSGIETRPGHKDHAAMTKLFTIVRGAA